MEYRKLYSLNIAEIITILVQLGARHPPDAQVPLIGGSVPVLIDGPRPTINIDLIGDEIQR